MFDNDPCCYHWYQGHVFIYKYKKQGLSKVYQIKDVPILNLIFITVPFTRVRFYRVVPLKNEHVEKFKQRKSFNLINLIVLLVPLSVI